MKKTIYASLLLILNFAINAQSIQYETKWITNEDYSLIFYSINDTTKTEIAQISTSIKIDNSQISQSTIMKGKMLKNDFIDITINKSSNLSPLIHSSSNDQRILTIAYSKEINAFYRGTRDEQLKTYTDATNEDSLFLDSSFYQTALRWLPLKNGYTTEIPIYNYDPNKKSGKFKVKILEVKTEKYATKKSGVREVWKVTELYEVSGVKTVHYIDKENRVLWKQEINNGKLIMIRVE